MTMPTPMPTRNLGLSNLLAISLGRMSQNCA